MFKSEKWALAGIAIIMFSLIVSSCFKPSEDEATGSSVPAPGAFILGVPGDMAMNIDLSGSISVTGLPMTWTVSTNAATYLLEISKDNSFTAGNSVYSPTWASNITAITLATTTFAANTIYYWRVKAINASGTVTASNAPFSFYTGSSALHHYRVVPDSYSIVSGTAISVTITAQDVFSNTVTTASIDITMTMTTTSGTPTVTFYKAGSWNSPPIAYANPWTGGVAQISIKAATSGATSEKFTIKVADAAAKYGTSGEITVSP